MGAGWLWPGPGPPSAISMLVLAQVWPQQVRMVPSLLPSSLPPSFPHKPLCDDDGVIVTGRSALFLLVKITNSQPKIIVQRFEDFPTSI